MRREKRAKSVGKNPDEVCGGFVLMCAWLVVAVWRSYAAGQITLRQLRVWEGLQEMRARRCTLKGARRAQFSPGEVLRLVGGVGEAAVRRDVKRLAELGLVRVTRSAIEFPGKPEELRMCQAEVELASQGISSPRRLVPVPRRVLRYLAASSKRSLHAAALGHALRVLYFARGEIRCEGLVKSRWVADVFGISVRAAKAARAELQGLGVIIAAKTPAWVERRYGKRFVWNLAWHAGEDARRSAPIPELSTSGSAPTESNKKLPNGSRNQKPGRDCGGPAGSRMRGKRGRPPSSPALRDVRDDDLRNTARLLLLFEEAAKRRLLAGTGSGRLMFVAAAEHALAQGRRPTALFAHLVRRGLWHFATQRDEDRARRRIACLEGEGGPLTDRFAGQAGLRSGGDVGALVRMVCEKLPKRGKTFDLKLPALCPGVAPGRRRVSAA